MIEDFRKQNTFYHAPSDRFYTLIQRAGEYFQRRHQKGFQGQQTNIVEKRIDYVIGSGAHARSYLHRTGEGKLVELPVSWYSEKGGYWAMSPGFDRADHQDFRRAVQQDCLFCHNGYPSPGAPVPEGIDCQRCHGPGKAHVDAAGKGPIVNPARLGRERQLEVCLQCHLETTSSPLPHMVQRYDRAPFSYRPGEPLGDTFLYFDHAPGKLRDSKFEIAHAGYRLRQSACFQKSEMTCTTCHNPHDIPRAEQAAKRYKAVCRNCHAAAHAQQSAGQGNCADCHMPKRRAGDAVHVVMTDHYIQRRKPAGDLLAPLDEAHQAQKRIYRGEVVPYYPPGFPRNREEELYLAVAQVQHGSNPESGIPRLEKALSKNGPAQPDFYVELGRAFGKTGEHAKAVHWFGEALRRRPDYIPAQIELGASFLAAGNFTGAAQVLEKIVTADARVLTNLGNAYLRLGDADRARQALSRALALDAEMPDAHNLLGMAAASKGEAALAEECFRNAIRSQPDLAEARHNLGELLAGRRDYQQAAYHFAEAVNAKPSYAQARHSYGLVLLLMGETNKALAQLKETVRLDPGNAAAQSDLTDLQAALAGAPRSP